MKCQLSAMLINLLILPAGCYISFHLVLVKKLACLASIQVQEKSFSPAGLGLFTALYFVFLFFVRSLNVRIEP